MQFVRYMDVLPICNGTYYSCSHVLIKCITTEALYTKKKWICLSTEHHFIEEMRKVQVIIGHALTKSYSGNKQKHFTGMF